LIEEEDTYNLDLDLPNETTTTRRRRNIDELNLLNLLILTYQIELN